MAGKKSAPQHHDIGLALIAAFKLVKCVLLVGVGAGALWFRDHDFTTLVNHWANLLQVGAHNRWLHRALLRLELVQPGQFKLFGIATLVYAALFLTEGVGLWLEKKWAEYLTIALTASFIPLEITHLVNHLRPATVVVLAINGLSVAYLIGKVRQAPHAATSR